MGVGLGVLRWATGSCFDVRPNNDFFSFFESTSVFSFDFFTFFPSLLSLRDLSLLSITPSNDLMMGSLSDGGIWKEPEWEDCLKGGERSTIVGRPVRGVVGRALSFSLSPSLSLDEVK
jgi:hypothetical protein